MYTFYDSMYDIQAWHYSIFMINTQNLKKIEFTFIYTSLLHSKWWNNSFKDRCSPYNMLRYWSCKIRSERRTCVIPCEDDGKSLESRNMIYNINSCTRTILPVTSLRSLREQCGNFLKLICFYCTILIGNIIFRQQRQLFGLTCRVII